MSCVAVKISKDKIVMGSDSFIGYGYYTQIKDKEAKLFSTNSMVIGGTGYGDNVNLFRIFCRDRKPARSDEDGIIDFMSEFEKWGRDRNSNFQLNSDYFIVYKDRVWFITSSFYIKEITTYFAIGAGMEIAQTALSLGKDVKEAIEVACELSIYCEPPVNIIEIAKS